MATTPPLVTAAQYTALITSEHNQAPNFMAMNALDVQPFVDNQNLWLTLYQLYSVYTAVGVQLDALGEWIGATRHLTTTVAGISVLDDPDYRILLEAVIAQNNWDGTVPGAYNIWAVVFASAGFQIFIQDNQDMTMFLVFLASGLTNVVLAMILNGYLDLRPAGVGMLRYFEPSVNNVPFFGLDAENATVSGLDVGAWVVPITG